jgi:hypothetical protein
MRQKYHDSDTTKRRELIYRLSEVLRSLEQAEPLEVWQIIRKKLTEAKDQKFDGDIAAIYLPLKPSIPEPSIVNMVLIDGCGFDFDNPIEYNYLGIAGTTFVASEMEGI